MFFIREKDCLSISDSCLAFTSFFGIQREQDTSAQEKESKVHDDNHLLAAEETRRRIKDDNDGCNFKRVYLTCA